MTNFATEVGRQPDIVLYYTNWGEAFQTRFAAQVQAHGATPFVQIEPERVSLARLPRAPTTPTCGRTPARSGRTGTR